MDFRGQEDVRECDNIRVELQPYIQSQYGSSTTIYQILDDFRSNINPSKDMLVFYDNIFNIATANGVGLDVWGEILVIGRTITDPINGKKFTLEDDEYRSLLYYKALANITDASLATLNYMLNKLFPELGGVVFNVIDEKQREDGTFYNNYPMHVRFAFAMYLTDVQLAIFRIGANLIVGAGVGWSLVMIDTDNTFGFNGSLLQPFNNGVFDPYPQSIE